MALKRSKINPNAGSKSTKELNGIRRNGVLYLDKGVGTGCFSNINPTSSSIFENNTGSEYIIPENKKRNER